MRKSVFVKLGKAALRPEHRLNAEELNHLAEAFKVLGDLTKLRICMLLSGQELSVSHLAKSLELSDSAVSHSLRILRNLRLVKYRRQGKLIYYSLDDEHVEGLLRVGRQHVKEEPA